jgi:deoxyribodipyrimidine photolyase-related protein
MANAFLIYPNQLFEEWFLENPSSIAILIEDPLFFSQYKFHKKKLVLHRASMKCFEDKLKDTFRTLYIEFNELKHSSEIGEILSKNKIKEVTFIDPCDDWLESRLKAGLENHEIKFIKKPNSNFLTPLDWADKIMPPSSKSYFFTSFYIEQRKRLKVLTEKDLKPVGEKWSFDSENRKKLPKDLIPPPPLSFKTNKYVSEATNYVDLNFAENPGTTTDFNYPITKEQALESLMHFLEYKLELFGIFEDAISSEHTFNFHSLLTIPLNIGLINPDQVVKITLEYSNKNKIPLNSLEGFIRQVIGWREYIRIMYLRLGRKQRTSNALNFTNPMPKLFYSAQSPLPPLNKSIERTIDHAYCHHIERLMILGNMFLLCEIHPDEVYKWFMEMFIDSYDWVMVPNVYGMSQFSDGGKIVTKPYISGSNYIKKMSDYKDGPWTDIWDGLYWRFIDKHRSIFLSNPRMGLMPRQFDKMDRTKKDKLLRSADSFLSELFN